LIVPRHQSDTFLELLPESLGGIVEAAQYASSATVDGLQFEQFDIFSNNGTIAEQSSFHFIWHATITIN
jgi:diadenosine tetraphosphate (Ap4A) HIT family hydrolase